MLASIASVGTRHRVTVPLVASAVISLAVLLLAATPGLSRPLPPEGLPSCQRAEVAAPMSGYDEWRWTLLDPAFAVRSDYVPPDLERRSVGGRAVTLRTFVFEPLDRMLTAARSAGATIVINSGYRSHSEQSRLASRLDHADDLVAEPGHSEHQLGTAIDVSGAVEWLAQHSWEYGFVLSYPPGRSPSWTCYRAEPWHFRYFGRDNAQLIFESGLSPREWLWAKLRG